MKNVMKSLVAVIALAAVAGAYGQKTKPAPKTMICPYCKMTMTMKKSKAAPVAVKLKTGTYYCCATCHPAPKKK
jgi:hypothetical protein